MLFVLFTFFKKFIFIQGRIFPLRWVGKAVSFKTVLPAWKFGSTFNSLIIYSTDIILHLLFAGMREEQDRRWESS